MRKNSDVREAARKNGVFLYEIADALGVSEPTFNRWLRKEMNEKQKADAFAAIEKIAANKRIEGNSSANEQDIEITQTGGLDEKIESQNNR